MVLKAADGRQYPPMRAPGHWCLALAVPLHYKLLEFLRRAAHAGRYLWFLLLVTFVGDVELL